MLICLLDFPSPMLAVDLDKDEQELGNRDGVVNTAARMIFLILSPFPFFHSSMPPHSTTVNPSRFGVGISSCCVIRLLERDVELFHVI